ncbi:hypothetical protein QMW84_16660 [Cronobacter sakazakii]|nr:hypothetical protein [Cronobacter sakazakii]MDI7565148.1 hypothetical protein [Cronobacter sakazakii]MDI7567382.1 hypothetical protein [Cronobacter sakazakii]MDI7572367.1 hypothetical protein [Cronobacter sakazakii]MDI7577307.1 hypothetical protein [Cronobacter sakazakii]
MSKATTTAALQSAALKEFSARNQRYWSASSLPTREKVKHRRDRVMSAILRRDINRKWKSPATKSSPALKGRNHEHY